MLEAYLAAGFDTVEVNNTFYRLPLASALLAGEIVVITVADTSATGTWRR